MARKTAADHGDPVQSEQAFSYDRFVNLPWGRDLAAPGAVAARAAPKTPTITQEVSFVTGLTPDGVLTDTSYWGSVGGTAFKWGDATLGTGATITYSFDSRANFSDVEKATFLKAFATWSSVANVTFVESRTPASAGVVLMRGHDGGAYTSTPTSDGSGATPGSVNGQAKISIDTSVPGFDLSGSLDKSGGYGMSTIIHEVGHLLGLGHGGAYNGDVNPRTDQFSAFDDRMYTIMSYVNWASSGAKYASQNPYQNTDWGTDNGGNPRSAPHTVMGLDIVAIQQLYGASEHTPFTGGQTYGFHSTITGPLAQFYDFSTNTSPVVTLFSEGTGNTLDLSEWSMGGYVDMRPGAFSSVGGLVNNLFVDFSTDIAIVVAGSGNDTIIGNDLGATLKGGGGSDLVVGGAGNDWLEGDGGRDELVGGLGKDLLFGGNGADYFDFNTLADSNKAATKADVILDFDHLDGDRIFLANIDAVKGGADNAFKFIGTGAFTRHAGELHYQVGSGEVLLSGDVNGDGKADFLIHVANVQVLVASDFVL